VTFGWKWGFSSMRLSRLCVAQALVALACAHPSGIDLGPYRRAPIDEPGITIRLEVIPGAVNAADSIEFRIWARNIRAERFDFISPCGPPVDAVFSTSGASGVSALRERSPDRIFTCQGYTIAAFDSLLVRIPILAPTRGGEYRAIAGVRTMNGLANLSAQTSFQVRRAAP